eukprot:2040256-Rhodomonas_salina.1
MPRCNLSLRPMPRCNLSLCPMPRCNLSLRPMPRCNLSLRPMPRCNLSLRPMLFLSPFISCALTLFAPCPSTSVHTPHVNDLWVRNGAEGGAFKLSCRDARGVPITLIADNYFGYCKKEVKTQ